MATYNHAFLVSSCSAANRPSISQKFNHSRASLSSSIKPFVRGLPKIPSLGDAPNVFKGKSLKLLEAVVDLTFQFADQELPPSQSNYAPVEETREAVPVSAVEGCIPDDFPEGVYIRNGPNPPFGGLKDAKSVFGRTSSVWVEGEGMVHALNFKKNSNDGWNTLYSNRYIQTESLEIEKERNRPVFLPATEGDSMAVTASLLLNFFRFGNANKMLSNTNVFEHSGKYYTAAENHMPHEIDIVTLETVGQLDLGGAWNRPFTTHPKKAPGSDELVIVGVHPLKPHFELGVISADGKSLVHKVDLKFERCTVSHEIGVTQRYNVILDFPLTIDFKRLILGGAFVKYDREGYARIGVMPRHGDADSIRWFDVEPCNVFHILNCFEDGDEVAVIACKAREAIIPGPEFGKDKFEWFSRAFKPLSSLDKIDENSVDGSLFTRAYEWRLNMKTGEVKEKNLTGTEFSMDFPFVNERFIGIKNKYGYAQVVDSIASSNAGIAKYGGLAKLCLEENELEQSSGGEMTKVEYHKFPANTFCTGAAFAPKPGGLEEDEGWIISFVHNEDTNISQAYIVDPKNFSSEPVAKIALPSRVPYGFHGVFLPMNS